MPTIEYPGTFRIMRTAYIAGSTGYAGTDKPVVIATNDLITFTFPDEPAPKPEPKKKPACGKAAPWWKVFDVRKRNAHGKRSRYASQ